jgi:hypothetical protein
MPLSFPEFVNRYYADFLKEFALDGEMFWRGANPMGVIDAGKVTFDASLTGERERRRKRERHNTARELLEKLSQDNTLVANAVEKYDRDPKFEWSDLAHLVQQLTVRQSSLEKDIDVYRKELGMPPKYRHYVRQVEMPCPVADDTKLRVAFERASDMVDRFALRHILEAPDGLNWEEVAAEIAAETTYLRGLKTNNPEDHCRTAILFRAETTGRWRMGFDDTETYEVGTNETPLPLMIARFGDIMGINVARTIVERRHEGPARFAITFRNIRWKDSRGMPLPVTDEMRAGGIVAAFERPMTAAEGAEYRRVMQIDTGVQQVQWKGTNETDRLTSRPVELTPSMLAAGMIGAVEIGPAAVLSIDAPPTGGTIVLNSRGPMQTFHKCPDCKGSGNYVGLTTTEKCTTCRGSGEATQPV